jgi:DNA-directed RNA polymerase subunit K/omega
MVKRPDDANAFEFVVLSALRAAQLQRGCTPRIVSDRKLVVVAQLEVAAGLVVRNPPETPAR